ncbi:MAG: hypothetical protein LBP92_08350 [Deltaproteobacteria bacterium]|jgi:hypothetical protein|nr:hypothetical protein [Deltaproteobacteria bacterium]
MGGDILGNAKAGKSGQSILTIVAVAISLIGLLDAYLDYRRATRRMARDAAKAARPLAGTHEDGDGKIDDEMLNKLNYDIIEFK